METNETAMAYYNLMYNFFGKKDARNEFFQLLSYDFDAFKNYLDDIIIKLPPLERFVISEHFALKGNKKQTLEEISKDFGLSLDDLQNAKKNALSLIKSNFNWHDVDNFQKEKRTQIPSEREVKKMNILEKMNEEGLLPHLDYVYFNSDPYFQFSDEERLNFFIKPISDNLPKLAEIFIQGSLSKEEYDDISKYLNNAERTIERWQTYEYGGNPKYPSLGGNNPLWTSELTEQLKNTFATVNKLLDDNGYCLNPKQREKLIAKSDIQPQEVKHTDIPKVRDIIQENKRIYCRFNTVSGKLDLPHNMKSSEAWKISKDDVLFSLCEAVPRAYETYDTKQPTEYMKGLKLRGFIRKFVELPDWAQDNVINDFRDFVNISEIAKSVDDYHKMFVRNNSLKNLTDKEKMNIELNMYQTNREAYKALLIVNAVQAFPNDFVFPNENDIDTFHKFAHNEWWILRSETTTHKPLDIALDIIQEKKEHISEKQPELLESFTSLTSNFIKDIDAMKTIPHDINGLNIP